METVTKAMQNICNEKLRMGSNANKTTRAKNPCTQRPKTEKAQIFLPYQCSCSRLQPDKYKDYLKHETKKHNNGSILDSGRKKLRKCQRHMPYKGRGIPKINNTASTPFPPAPPNLILQSGRFSLAKLFPGKGRIFRDNLELSILNWGVRGVTKQKKKIKAARFYLQSFFRPQQEWSPKFMIKNRFMGDSMSQISHELITKVFNLPSPPFWTFTNSQQNLTMVTS